MTTPKPLHVLVSFLMLTVALSGCATLKDGGSPDDAKISANVQKQLDRRPELGPPHSIDVQTVDHVVYMNGLVSTGSESETAASVADAAPGVARVVNDIAVPN